MTDERDILNEEEVDFEDNTPMIPYVSDKMKYYFLIGGLVLSIITTLLVVFCSPDSKAGDKQESAEQASITQYII